MLYIYIYNTYMLYIYTHICIYNTDMLYIQYTHTHTHTQTHTHTHMYVHIYIYTNLVSFNIFPQCAEIFL